MSKRIFNFELNGKPVLGFDTGLNAQAFAQAKMAQFITTPGFIVYPDGRVESWQPGGVTEQDTMIIWGPSFPGENLAGIINESGSKDEALNALRFWLRARTALEGIAHDGRELPYPGPAGAFIVTAGAGSNPGGYPQGAVFFPPARLLKRTLEAEGAEAVLESERWVHPDLEGPEALSFSTGAMLYRVFCGAPPFPGSESDGLHQDIREGVFIPPELAAPGIDPAMAAVISRAMSRTAQNKEENIRPSPDFISGFIGPPASKPVSSWVKPLSGEELSKIRAEQEQYSRKKARAVKTRRFMVRNTTVITISVIVFVILVLIVRGAIQHQAEQPTTKGMSPVEVAQTYYDSFGTLDHTMMDACVTGKAGKGDVEMVINLFVISRVRQAYEVSQGFSMSAQDWIDAGRPVTDKTVFGITDLKIQPLSESNANVSLEADYILWMPGSYFREGEDTPPPGETQDLEESAPIPPVGTITRDRLNLVLLKGAWRISGIDRETEGTNQGD